MLTGRPVEATSSAMLLLISQSEYEDFSILSLKLKERKEIERKKERKEGMKKEFFLTVPEVRGDLLS